MIPVGAQPFSLMEDIAFCGLLRQWPRLSFPECKEELYTSWQTSGAASRIVRAQLRPQEGTVLLPGYQVVLLYVQGRYAYHMVQNIATATKSGRWQLHLWLHCHGWCQHAGIVKASCSIVCLLHMLQLVVKVALELKSTVKAICCAVSLDEIFDPGYPLPMQHQIHLSAAQDVGGDG